MAVLKVRFKQDYYGYKAGSVWAMLDTQYYQLKKLGIVNLVAGPVDELWKVTPIDEEE